MKEILEKYCKYDNKSKIYFYNEYIHCYFNNKDVHIYAGDSSECHKLHEFKDTVKLEMFFKSLL